jgi:S-layer protein Slr4
MKLNLKIVAATAAVAMMSTGVAQAAASISVQPAATYTYSKEGLALSGTTGVALPTIRVTFGNSLTYQDDIYITLPGVTSVAAVPTPTLVVCSSVNPTVPSVGYVTTVNGGWNFRVTSVNGVTIGDYCDFTPLSVQGASLANSNSVLNYQANRFQTGQLVDSATSNSSIVIKSQFGISGNGLPVGPAYIPLNGEIDVYASRLQFTTAESVGSGAGATNPLQADTLAFQTTVDGNATTYTGPVVTVSKQVVTIDNGSFAWTDTAAPAGTCFDSGLFSFTGWSVDTTTSTCNSLVLNGPTGNTTNDGYFYVPGTKILSPADWAGKVKWTYYLGSTTNVGSTELTWDPGVWTINGAQVYIQYMPYGTGISRIVYAANSGVINADGTVDVIANGTTTTCNLGAIASKTVTQLSAIVDACVAGAGIVNGRVALLMTFTAPDVDIEVYSAYNVGGSDRGTVVNTSNGRGLTYFSKVD